MTLGYERAVEWLEDAQPSDLRAQDVIKIIGLHMEYVKTFEADRESGAEEVWTEEDEAAIADIVKEVDELEDHGEVSGEERPGEREDESD